MLPLGATVRLATMTATVTLPPHPACRGCFFLPHGCRLAAAAEPYAPQCSLARLGMKRRSSSGSALPLSPAKTPLSP